ncbi:hypothetical protein Hdeb2414_s0026g00680441 [Helianthus debilis subsp. tardiflorus]
MGFFPNYGFCFVGKRLEILTTSTTMKISPTAIDLEVNSVFLPSFITIFNVNTLSTMHNQPFKTHFQLFTDTGAIMAVASASMLVALKTYFIILAWVMADVLVYSFAADGQVSCFQPSKWWMQVAEYDIVIILPIMAFFYKESSWIKRIVFLII